MAMMSKQKSNIHSGSQKVTQTQKCTSNSIKYEGAVYSFFFGYEGFVYHELLPRDQTVNKVMKHLREAVRRKRLNRGGR